MALVNTTNDELGFESFGHTVYAAECLAKQPSGRVCAVTFDFRAKDGLDDIKARCPVCGTECEVRAQWRSDDNGYHVSREVIMKLAIDRGITYDKLRDLETEVVAKLGNLLKLSISSTPTQVIDAIVKALK